MYYQIEFLKLLNIPFNQNYHICYIKANKDRTKICALIKNGVLLWLTPSNQLISFFLRSKESIETYGENLMVEWKNDSTKIAILTTNGYIIFYKLMFEHNNSLTSILFGEKFLGDTTIKDSFYQYHIVKCKLKQESILRITNRVKNFYNFNDELFVSLYNGEIIKLHWNSLNEYSFLSIRNIPLKLELTDNAKSLNLDYSTYVIDFEFTNFMGGICIALVLSDGSAAYLVGESTDSENTFQGLVAEVVGQEKLWKLHNCVTINPIYQILAYGCKNGQAIAYYPDEVTLSLQLSNTYTLNQQTTSFYGKQAVVKMKWTPDYRVLTVLYESGAISLFSVFGSLLYYSNNFSVYSDVLTNQLNVFKGMDFGPEGYSLWLYTEPNETESSSILGELKFLKSNLANNLTSTTEHIVLQNENKIRVCLNVNKLKTPLSQTHETVSKLKHDKSHSLIEDHPTILTTKLGGNNMWQLIDVPLNYIATNYPLRFVAIDQHGRYIAVAGMYGFTHFAFASRKWKLFGNATQEKDMTVTSGMLWWKDFICLGCFNFLDGRNEIRFYSRHTNLDNNYASIIKLPCSVLKMNVFEDILIILCSDCHINLYALDAKHNESKLYVNFNKLNDFSIENYVSGNPFSIVSVALSELRVEVGLNKIDLSASTLPHMYMESILINVSGRLLMFQREKNGPLVPARNIKKLKSLSFSPPIIIASCVENMWTISNIECSNTYMKLSLWLSCGANGMKVWIPLSHKEDSVRFQSHRIMLSFPLAIYPLAILINEALILGVTNDYNQYDNQIYYNVNKTTQIFMHSLLMQLLRKNLDFDALQISKFTRSLPHFSHILELLLHQILEQEATSSEPIPDPLLPRVVVFVHEFPEFLQIVSHCTRKTDIALWPYLFVIVGNPSDMFEACLDKGFLETAASYLIILQNTETPDLCKKHASMLLEAALKESNWKLSKDIIRFLSSIDPSDLESGKPISIIAPSPYVTLKKDMFLPASITSTKTPPMSPQQLNNPNSQPNSQQKPTSAFAKATLNKKLSIDSKKGSIDSPTQKQAMNTSFSPAKQDNLSMNSTITDSDFLFDINYIEKIINDYAMKLLKTYKLKELGYMFSNLSFSILKWLKREPSCLKVENFSEALFKIHQEFHWPLPLPLPLPISTKFNKENGDINSLFNVPEENVIGSKNSIGSDSQHDEIVSDLVSKSSHRSRMHSSVSDSVITASESKAISKAFSEESSDVFQVNSDTEELMIKNSYLNLITQELANKGPPISENQLEYLIEMFMSAECYEWAFLLALVLKDYTIVGEIIYKYKTSLAKNNLANFQKGLNELYVWAKTDYSGYYNIIHNIINYMEGNYQNGSGLGLAHILHMATMPKHLQNNDYVEKLEKISLNNNSNHTNTKHMNNNTNSNQLSTTITTTSSKK